MVDAKEERGGGERSPKGLTKGPKAANPQPPQRRRGIALSLMGGQGKTCELRQILSSIFSPYFLDLMT